MKGLANSLKKGPDLAIILGSHKGHEDDGEDEGGDAEQAKMDAADALIEALHAKDAQGVVEAMSTFHDLCANEDEGADDEEENS